MVTVLGQLLVAMRRSRRPLKYTIAAVTRDNTLISQMRTVMEEETLVAQGFVGLLSVWTRPPQSDLDIGL